MAEPLAQLTEKTLNVPALRLFGKDANRVHILETLSTIQPALVYSAGHGLGAPRQPLEFQKQFNGAIICQEESSGQPLQERLFSANDIPLEKPFIEGCIFFQFACFGYGTPAISDFAHWQEYGTATRSVNVDFVAALPKRMLAHPHGPIAFIGHVDMAWLHGFADPDDPELNEWWSPRLKPFNEALASLLSTQPVGYALREMNKRYNSVNAYLTNLIDTARQMEASHSEERTRKIAYSYIVRNDAQNYMVFGDPAVRLRIPA